MLIGKVSAISIYPNLFWVKICTQAMNGFNEYNEFNGFFQLPQNSIVKGDFVVIDFSPKMLPKKEKSPNGDFIVVKNNNGYDILEQKLIVNTIIKIDEKNIFSKQLKQKQQLSPVVQLNNKIEQQNNDDPPAIF